VTETTNYIPELVELREAVRSYRSLWFKRFRAAEEARRWTRIANAHRNASLTLSTDTLEFHDEWVLESWVKRATEFLRRGT
jgi:hypothetical protein